MDYRTVFVFICRDADCSKENNASNIRVFRSQLRRDNEFYPPDPAKVSMIQIKDIKKEYLILILWHETSFSKQTEDY